MPWEDPELLLQSIEWYIVNVPLMGSTFRDAPETTMIAFQRPIFPMSNPQHCDTALCRLGHPGGTRCSPSPCHNG